MASRYKGPPRPGFAGFGHGLTSDLGLMPVFGKE
jgi:hypothetical protein